MRAFNFNLQIELLELKKYLAQIEQENRDIQARISKKKAINEKMADRIEEKVQARQAIVEKYLRALLYSDHNIFFALISSFSSPSRNEQAERRC